MEDALGVLKKYEANARLEKDYNISGLNSLKNKILEVSGAEDLNKFFTSFRVTQKSDQDVLIKSLFYHVLGYTWNELHPFQTAANTPNDPTLYPVREDEIPFVVYTPSGEVDDLHEFFDKNILNWLHSREDDLIQVAIATNFRSIQVFDLNGPVEDLDIDLKELFRCIDKQQFNKPSIVAWKNFYKKFSSQKVHFKKALNKNLKTTTITGLEYQRRFGNEPYAQPPKGIGTDGKGYERLFKTQKGLPFFQKEVIDFGNPKNPVENKLIWGDNLAIMRDLPDESIDLIYIDPPFFSGRNYNFIFNDKSEVKTFTDIWDEGLDGYIVWLNARLWEMKRLLKSTGSLVVHLDKHACHYIKCELDKIFGYNNFQNEIIWSYRTGGASKKRFGQKHDNLFWYTKSEKDYTYHCIKERIYYEKPFFNPSVDENGRYYADVIPDDTWEIKALLNLSLERIGYPTQKPEELLKKIINSMTNPGDTVADFFCGGGTTAAVAEKLGRKWITTDISRIAISVARDRLANVYTQNTGIEKSQDNPHLNFSLEYHGCYEKNDIHALKDNEYIDFILKCYGAKNAKDGQNIHGYKSGYDSKIKAIHVDLSRNKITRSTVEKFHRAIESRGDEYELGGVILCWGYDKNAYKYIQEVQKNAYGKSLQLVQIELTDIEGPDFAGNNVKFISTPNPNFEIIDQKGLVVDFDATTSLAENNKSVIYYQWDFDFKGSFMPVTKINLGKDKDGDGNPLNDHRRITYEYPKPGKYKVALRIYDEDGGEAQVVKEIDVDAVSQRKTTRKRKAS